MFTTPESSSSDRVVRAVENPAAAFQEAVAAAAEEEAYAIGIEAYLYGYPRVELARRIHNETKRVSEDQVIYAPPNRFYYFDHLGRPGDGLVIKAPNNDTMYASAYLNLSTGPVVLRVPDTGGRYYVALIVDAAGSVATRLNRTVSGPGGLDYLFTGPGYEGAVPLGMRQIKQSGNDLWLLMRVACSGDKDEAEAVNILRRFGLAKLADLASLPETNVNVPVINAPIEKVLAPLDNLQFFRVMATMLERNLVPDSDRGLLDRWRRIGLIPGRFDLAGLSPAMQRGLTRAITAGSRIPVAGYYQRQVGTTTGTENPTRVSDRVALSVYS